MQRNRSAAATPIIETTRPKWARVLLANALTKVPRYAHA
jgi:hypothetical protein